MAIPPAGWNAASSPCRRLTYTVVSARVLVVLVEADPQLAHPAEVPGQGTAVAAHLDAVGALLPDRVRLETSVPRAPLEKRSSAPT